MIVTPAVNRYFYVPDTDLDLSAPAAIPAASFTTDDGGPAAGFEGLGPNGYADLYINGILQPGGLYGVEPAALTIDAGGGAIYAGTPIILAVVQWTAKVVPS